LLQQVDRRRAQHEEATLALPAPPGGIDEPAQAAKELRRALDLVEDDELVRVLREVQLRLRELRPVGLRLEIEIDRRPRGGQFERQGGLADLARPEQRRGRGFDQGRSEVGNESAGNHACNCGSCLHKCKRTPAAAHGGT